MGPKPKPLDSKNRDDSPHGSKTLFDPVIIESKTANTAILALSSIEDAVVVRAISALDKFATKDEQNLLTLFELGILHHLLPLLSHQDVTVRRFAMKFLGQMAQASVVRKILLDEGHILLFMSLLKEHEDVVIHEFATLVLAELTADILGTREFLNYNYLPVIFQRLANSKDPDVQKNSIQIMYNILQDPEAIECFRDFSEWKFEPLIALFKSDYPVIQTLAMKLVSILTKYPDMAALFKESNGLQETVGILEKSEWSDVHTDLLNILKNFVKTISDAEYLAHINAFRKLVDYIRQSKNPLLQESAVGVIVEVAKLDFARALLYEQGTELLMVDELFNASPGVQTMAALGIVQMAKHAEAVQSIMKNNPVKQIMLLLVEESNPPVLRQAVSQALAVLLQSGNESCAIFRNENGIQEIHKIVQSGTQEEISVNLLNCLTILSVHNDIRVEIAGPQLMQTLMSCLEKGSYQLKIAACEALCGYMCEACVRDLFVKMSGPAWITKCLTLNNVPLKLAAATAIKIAGSDKNVATAFIGSGALNELVVQKHMKIYPVWESTMRTLFNNSLSAKFSLTGRLEPTDITDDLFYAAPRPIAGEKFPMLKDILALSVSPIRPIYIANFTQEVVQQSIMYEVTQETSPQTEAQKRISIRKTRHRSTVQIPKETLLSVVPPPAEDDLTPHASLTPDPYLIGYVEELKTRTADLASIEEQASEIAQFVAERMCGQDQEMKCINHFCELHLAEIKKDLGTNLIPLGYIRIGSFAERAILFKVLADKVGFPCALVRGPYDRTWVEVTVLPEDSEGYPTHMIRPNYIVDLMYDVGCLLALDSPKGEMYMAKII